MKVNPNYQSVLRFWRDVEIFDIPSAPNHKNKEENAKIFYPGRALPWAPDNPKRLSPNSDYTWVHTVFIGVAEKKRWARVVLETVVPGTELSTDDLERINKNGWLAAFTVDEDGRPVTESLVPASFALGLVRLKQGKGLDGINKDIEKARRDFDERWQVMVEQQNDTERPGIVDAPDELQNEPQTRITDWAALQEESDLALAQLGLSADDFPCRVMIKSVRYRRQNSESKQDGDIEYLNSFFLNDLDRLIDMAYAGKVFGQALTAYLTGYAGKDAVRDVLVDHDAMAACVRPERLPAGRWPAKSSHHLMLAQQAAVSEIVSRLSYNTGLVAVNGPPGTGKTTILRDVIAEVIVQRASRLAGLASPWQAFTEASAGGKRVYPPKSEIVGGTSIVVASNNNSAVENITRELPDRTEIAVSEFNDAAYFMEVAQNIFDKTKIETRAWGLVAAVLGKNKNRRQLANGLFQDNSSCNFKPGTPVDMKPLLEFWDKQCNRETAKTSWESARQTFLKLKNEFAEKRKCLIKWQKLLNSQSFREQELAKIKKDVARSQLNLEKLSEYWSDKLSSAERVYQQATSKLRSAQYLTKSAELAARVADDRLKNAEEKEVPPFWERWLEIIGLRTKKVKNWRSVIAQLRAERAESAKHLSEELANLNQAHQAQQLARQQLNEVQESEAREKRRMRFNIDKLQAQAGQIEKELNATRKQLENIKASGVCLPDKAFFNQGNNQHHLLSVWVTDELDHLRAELFLAAIELHKWTVCSCAGRYIANLRMLKKMLLNDISEPLTGNERRVLWDVLFFLVPVVSTTLASFDRLFKGMGKESLGWLLIDEAGQATPQSVAGALWRSRRAVIIGDPLQVEPVMTVPEAVVAELRKHYNVSGCWSPVGKSAQTLADRSMNLGTRVGSVWTGLPLRAHRRCIDPMFRVANTIAYAGQMVQANTNPPTMDCVLGESVWFDVSGTRVNGHVVAEEMKVLLDLLIHLRDNWPTLSDGKRAEVFVITPFRDVAKEAKEVIYRAGLKNWQAKYGTVHAFQGKQAEIVFIVLGTKPGREGEGSRVWASKSPNILNVALTRARLRVYVIGNNNEWGNLPGFNEMAKHFKRVAIG